MPGLPGFLRCCRLAACSTAFLLHALHFNLRRNDSRRSSLNEQRLEGLPAVEGASAVAASRAGAAGTGVQQARGEQVEGSGVLSAQGGLTFNDDYFDQQGQGLGGAGAAGGAGQQELEQQGSGSVAGGAAAATERSSSEQQQQQQGVAGGMRRSNTKGGAAGSEGGMDASAAFGAEASVAFEEFEEQPARKASCWRLALECWPRSSVPPYLPLQMP